MKQKQTKFRIAPGNVWNRAGTKLLYIGWAVQESKESDGWFYLATYRTLEEAEIVLTYMIEQGL